MSRLETFNTIVIGGELILRRPAFPEGLTSSLLCGVGEDARYIVRQIRE